MRNPPYGAVPYPPPSPPMRPTEIAVPTLISTPKRDPAGVADGEQARKLGVTAMRSPSTAARRKRTGGTTAA